MTVSLIQGFSSLSSDIPSRPWDVHASLETGIDPHAVSFMHNRLPFYYPSLSAGNSTTCVPRDSSANSDIDLQLEFIRGAKIPNLFVVISLRAFYPMERLVSSFVADQATDFC
jgi:hypothetical protein